MAKTAELDDFALLKKTSKTSLQQYSEEAKKLKTTFQEDERFWSLTTDKAGNGRAIIRFLPPIKGEVAPFVKYFSHGFQTASGWFIENCPTSLGDGKECPVCEYNTKLWAQTGDDDDHPLRKIVRDQKRKLHYVSNILVVSDDAKPENNGKPFLFRYGTKIYEKINTSMHPQYKDEEPVNPFDFWAGANFILKQQLVKKYPNFDLSAFESKISPVSESDAEIKEIWLKEHALLPFVAKENFKDYDSLKSRFNRIVGDKAAKGVAQSSKLIEEDDEPARKPIPEKKVAKSTNTEDFFANLADDDDD